VVAARELGCRRWQAGLIGLAYGLSTPAYVYATLAYGHQASAFALFASFLLLWKSGRSRQPSRISFARCLPQLRRGEGESRRAGMASALGSPGGSPSQNVSEQPARRIFAAGLLASYAAVIELQVGPVSAILGFYLLTQCLRRERRPDALGIFFVGALLPAVLLLIYNQLAFGSPWDMGYFHEAIRDFAQVHNPDNPTGLTRPDWTKLVPLLWGRYRGLLFYAPILALSVPGWVVLLIRRRWDVTIVSLLIVAAVFLVNLSYPQWTGGWSNGPRLLVPCLPFAMLPIAGLLAGKTRLAGVATIIAMVLALAGGAEMLLFQGIGGRIPQFVSDPIPDAVWPLWTTGNPLPWWRYGERFCCNLVTLTAPDMIARLDPRWRALQFLPLVLAQGLAIIGLGYLSRDEESETTDG